MTDFDKRCTELDKKGITYSIRLNTSSTFLVMSSEGDWWVYTYDGGEEIG